jgi:Holliday junction resolvase
MKEANLNAQLIKELKKRGAYVVKTVVTTHAGVPDILACLNGKFIAIESKLPYNDLSELQKVHKAQIQQASGVYICAKHVSDLITVLDEQQSAIT